MLSESRFWGGSGGPRGGQFQWKEQYLNKISFVTYLSYDIWHTKSECYCPNSKICFLWTALMYSLNAIPMKSSAGIWGIMRCMTHFKIEVRSLWRLKGFRIFSLFTIIKSRSVAFLPCITLGGVHWVEMGQKIIFCKKWSTNTLFVRHGPGSSNFGVGWNPKF